MSNTQPKRQAFDLSLLKRLLGEPVLLGDETMENFDEFALSMASCLEPGDMAAHVLVYQYIMEVWLEMRLRRLQGHLIRLHGINIENQGKLAEVLKTSEAEANAFSAQQSAHAAQVRVNYLLTQTTKRIHSILGQISLYRMALAEKMRLQLDIEERRLRLRESQQTKPSEDSPCQKQ